MKLCIPLPVTNTKPGKEIQNCLDTKSKIVRSTACETFGVIEGIWTT